VQYLPYLCGKRKGRKFCEKGLTGILKIEKIEFTEQPLNPLCKTSFTSVVKKQEEKVCDK
jgi:hypothetical protein